MFGPQRIRQNFDCLLRYTFRLLEVAGVAQSRRQRRKTAAVNRVPRPVGVFSDSNSPSRVLWRPTVITIACLSFESPRLGLEPA